MKRGKRKLFLLCMLLATVTISACGKKDNADIESKKQTTIKETQESTKAEGDGSFPSENQMAKDIDAFGANVISLENGDYTLETKSIKIDKAKKDTEQYLVYCTAIQESDMFKANNSYVMTYNYYDIGGWVLDECYVENVDMIPKTCVSEEEARGYVYNEFTSLEFSEVEKISDVQYVYHYIGKYEYTYMDDVYNMDVTCSYDNQYGWSMYCEEISSYHDWSKMYGTWYGENPASSDWIYEIVVKEVDETAMQVKCDVTLKHPGKGDSKEILNGKDKLVKKNVTARILDEDEGQYFHDGDERDGFEYSGEIEKLCTYYSTGIDKEETASLALCWGRDVGMGKVFIDDGWGGSYFTYLNKKD